MAYGTSAYGAGVYGGGALGGAPAVDPELELVGVLAAPTWVLTGAYALDAVIAPADLSLDGELSAPSWTVTGAYQFVPVAPVDVTLDGAVTAPTWTLTGAYSFDAVVVADLALAGTLTAPSWTLVGDYDFDPLIVTYAPVVLADSPRAYWRLGDSSGTTMADSSGYARHGTYVNTPTLGAPGLVDGGANTAVTFNGTDESATIPYASWMNSSAISVEMWFKTTATGIVALVARDDPSGSARPWQIRLNAGRVEFLRLANSSNIMDVSTSTTAFAYNDGLAHHVVVVVLATSQVRIYVDGGETSSDGFSWGLQQPAGADITIGASQDAPGVFPDAGFFPGTLDEVAYYGTSLSPARILAHYNARLGHGASVDLNLAGTLALPDWTLTGVYEIVRPPQTDAGRISGRTRSGYGVATWFPPVVPLPASDTGAKMLVASAFGPQTMAGSQPVYTVSQAHTPRPRQQILVAGFDITTFRDTPTPDVTYQLQEPLLYGPGDLTLPQVACTEEFGTGDLWWLREDATVIVNEVLDDVVVRAGVYKGFIHAFDISGKTVIVDLGGEAHGAMEMMNRQVVVVPRVNDIGHQLAVDLDEAGIPHHPPLGRVTGIETLTTGGTGLLEHFESVLAQGWTRAGRQWTVMPDPVTGVYETHRKDDTTIHCTAFIDGAHTELTVRRDTSEEYNRIFGSGVTPRGMRVRNAIIPGLYQGPVPDFPGHMEIGDTGIGVQLLIQKLQAVNYLDLRDTPGGYDEDVAEAVVSLQEDAGFFEDGFTGTAVPGEVNLATWRALYDVDITGQSLAWARVLPMAQRSRVKEWRRSGTGGILGPNPGYDKTVRKRDRNIEFGAGLRRSQMFEFSKADLQDSEDPNWLGTATFHTGALLRGLVEIGQVITDADVMAASEALPGHNLWVPNFQGGTLFHIAASQVDDNGIVTLTIDTRFRDAPAVWEIMARNKESKSDPARRANQRHRSSTIVKDSIGEWFEHGGILGHDIRLNPGWNVFQVTAAMSGTIARLLLTVQTVTLDGETITVDGHEFVCAVFGREITKAKLAQIVANPLTADGKKDWRRRATRAQLKAHWILYSAGTDEEPCGYGEDLKSDGATLTGVHDDDSGFLYKSESRARLYVAVYVREAAENATIPAGQIMWPQLEAGA